MKNKRLGFESLLKGIIKVSATLMVLGLNLIKIGGKSLVKLSVAIYKENKKDQQSYKKIKEQRALNRLINKLKAIAGLLPLKQSLKGKSNIGVRLLDLLLGKKRMDRIGNINDDLPFFNQINPENSAKVNLISLTKALNATANMSNHLSGERLSNSISNSNNTRHTNLRMRQ
jgi:hypothetical protein